MIKYMRKNKKKIIAVIAIAYLTCSFFCFMFHSAKLWICMLKMDGLYTNIKVFENNNRRLPANIIELTTYPETIMNIDEIYCVCDKNAGYTGYIYQPQLTRDDPSKSVLLCDSRARHLSYTNTGYFCSMLFFYYGSDKVRIVIFHDGHREILTEREFETLQSNSPDVPMVSNK